jgi:hypothetical protein
MSPVQSGIGGLGELQQRSSADPGPRREADADAAAAFARALNAEPKPAEAPLPSPFALFGSAPEPASAELLWPAVSQLLVAEDGRSLRLTLDDPRLAGVSLQLGRAEGRLQLLLDCEQPAPHARLQAALPQLAAGLAERLHDAVSIGLALLQPGRAPDYEWARASP